MKTTKIRATIKKKDDYTSSVTIHGLLDHIACSVHNSIVDVTQKTITVELVSSDERRLCVQISPEMVYDRFHGPDKLWISKSLEA